MSQLSASFPIRLIAGFAIAVAVASPFVFPQAAISRESDRTLRLFFAHTGERGEFTFKRNGRLDRGEMRRLNHFLRDWRKKEDANMDPALLDLVWAIYRKSGSRDYIHVVSAYRSPATNETLRSRSSGVAKNSQHRLGKAMDWFVTDVPLSKLREIAMTMQGGGVGYYPKSGSPFVHVDTGNVRAWPRMSRQQLIALFPSGNTLHLPADGKPLPGYDRAVAQRRMSGGTVLAYADTPSSEAEDTDRTGTESSSGWLSRVFPRERSNGPAIAAADPVAVDTVDPITAAAVADLAAAQIDNPRMPRARPGEAIGGTDLALADPAPEDDSAIDEADASLMLSLADVAPLPRVRPGLDDDEEAIPTDAAPTGAASAGDAIAALTAAAAAPADSGGDALVALAFASPTHAPETMTEADRAIIGAFALVDASRGTIENADAVLTAAASRRAIQETPAFALARANATGASARRAAETPAATAGVVIGPDGEVNYATSDADGLTDLIGGEPPAPASADQALAMPDPQGEVMVAPDAASDVADLRGDSGPPVDRFARTENAPQPQPAAPDAIAARGTDSGFFTKLFATLVE